MNSKTFLLNGKIELRPGPEGEFDELLTAEGVRCAVHFEMMDDKTLWIGLYLNGHPHDCVHVRVSSRGKLKIIAEEA